MIPEIHKFRNILDYTLAQGSPLEWAKYEVDRLNVEEESPLTVWSKLWSKTERFWYPNWATKSCPCRAPPPPRGGDGEWPGFQGQLCSFNFSSRFFLYKSQSVHNNIFLSVWQGNIFQPCILGRAENQLLAMALVMPLLMAGLPASTARSGFFLTQPNRWRWVWAGPQTPRGVWLWLLKRRVGEFHAAFLGCAVYRFLKKNTKSVD